MGIFSSDKKTTNTTVYDTQTNTTQADQSGDGIKLFDVGSFGINTSMDDHSQVSTTNYLSDSGAIDAARGIAGDALTTVQRTNANSIDLLRELVGSSNDAQGRALDTVARVNSDSLDLLGGLVSESIDASRTLARDSADANSRTVADALSGFSTLAQRSAESTDDKMSRVIGYALAAVVAALVLPSLFKGAKATV